MNNEPLHASFFLLTLGSACGLAVGNILEKIGLHRTGQQVSLKTPLLFMRSLVSNIPWWLGLTLSALATLGYYAALGMYNISLVQPLMALNPVLTALMGWWFLRERMTARIGLAIGCIFVGLLLIGTQPSEAVGSQHIFYLLLYVLVWPMFLLLLRWRKLRREILDASMMGIGFGLSAVLYKSLTLDLPALESLSIATLLPWLKDLRLWAFVATYGTGFLYSQIALSRGRALFVIPFSAALGTLVPILAGALVFAEPFSPLKVASLACVVAGSFLFVERE